MRRKLLPRGAEKRRKLAYYLLNVKNWPLFRVKLLIGYALDPDEMWKPLTGYEAKLMDEEFRRREIERLLKEMDSSGVQIPSDSAHFKC